MSSVLRELTNQVPVHVKRESQVKEKKEISFEQAGTDSQIAKLFKTKDPNIQSEIRAAQDYLSIQNIEVGTLESKTEIKKHLEIDYKQENTAASKNLSTVRSLEI